MTNKDPAYLFYPSDFTMGTFGWNYEQIGKYITLLNLQHSKGGYLKEKDIKRILDFENEDDKEILDKFINDEKGYYNKRLLSEIERRKTHSEKQRANVMKRWKKKDTMVIPKGYDGNTDVIPLETETETEAITTNKNETLIVIEKPNYKEVLDYWNSYSMLKSITRMTDKRKTFVNARFKEFGLDDIKNMIDNISKSPFLRGQNNRNWIADFDWCFKPNNFVKILEGNYLDNATNKPNELEERLKAARERMGVVQ